jgi:hypothetical protein
LNETASAEFWYSSRCPNVQRNFSNSKYGKDKGSLPFGKMCVAGSADVLGAGPVAGSAEVLGAVAGSAEVLRVHAGSADVLGAGVVHAGSADVLGAGVLNQAPARRLFTPPPTVGKKTKATKPRRDNLMLAVWGKDQLRQRVAWVLYQIFTKRKIG